MSVPLPPEPTVQQPRNKMLLILIGVVLGAVVVIPAICVLAFQTGDAAVEGASKVADLFLLDKQRHDYASAEGLMANDVRSKLKASDLGDIQAQFEKRDGPETGHGSYAWNIGTFNGVAHVTLSCQEQFQRGIVAAQITLAPSAQGWRVTGYRYSM